jgi:hypothetical protein
MRKGLMLLTVGLVGVSLTACAGISGYTQPAGLFPVGLLYTETVSGSQVLDNGTAATKEGKACGTYIIFVGTGDTSVETAMKNGGIKKLVFVTQSVKMILGSLYGEVCTIARGV